MDRKKKPTLVARTQFVYYMSHFSPQCDFAFLKLNHAVNCNCFLSKVDHIQHCLILYKKNPADLFCIRDK